MTGCYGFTTEHNGVAYLPNFLCFNNIWGGILGLNLYLIEDAPQPKNAYPWMLPLPQKFTNGTDTLIVDGRNFNFHKEYPTSPDMDAAIGRAMEQLFPHKLDSSNGLATGIVKVGNMSAALQLYMDESYKLDITTSSITITADEIYGAYRALETLSQLMMFDHDKG
eukprot:gene1360-12505_t